MKKLFTLTAAAVLLLASCSKDENTVENIEGIDVTQMSEDVFVDYMNDLSIEEGIIYGDLNADESVYPFPIESILSEGKLSIEDPTVGDCIDRSIRNGSNEIANLGIDRSENLGRSLKVDYVYKAKPGYYIYSINMNIADDCSQTPTLANGDPDYCNFNVRNCFNSQVSNVRYRFARNCVPECSCTVAYVILYTLDQNGCVDQVMGEYVEGIQFGNQGTDGFQNQFCQDDCGEPIDN